MFETGKEVDEETVTKENNILLKREPSASLLSGNVDHLYEIHTPLFIETDVAKKKKIRKTEIFSVFLLNDVEITLHDKPIEKYMEK